MARVSFSGFELNSTTADMEFVVASGSIQTSIVRSGTYAGNISSLSSGTRQGFLQRNYSGNTSGPGYARVYLYISTLPSADNYIMGFSGGITLNNTRIVGIILRSSGALRLVRGASTQIGSDSSALSTGQWYCIEVYYDGSTDAGSHIAEARIDGASFASASNLTLANNNQWTTFIMGGNLNAEAQTQGDWYFDDVAVNDSSGSFQNSWPGSGKIIRLNPSASGDANSFATQTGGTVGAGNNFTRVNEITPDGATSFNGSSTLNEEDLFNVDNSSIGSGDTVNVVAVGGRFRNSTADTSAEMKFEIEKTGSGTISQSAGIVPNSTTFKTNATASPFAYPITLYQDPDASNWTQSTLDSMQIGYKLTTAPAVGGRRVDVTAVWALVDYTPSAGTTVTPDAIASTTAFYAPTITTGAVTVTPNAISSGTSFYNATITTGSVTVSPDALASTTQVYQPIVTQGGVIIEPDAIASTTQFYAPSVSTTITPDTISATVFFGPVITTGSVTVSPNHIASTTQVYNISTDAVRPYRLLNPTRRYVGPRGTSSLSRPSVGPRGTLRGPRLGS